MQRRESHSGAEGRGMRFRGKSLFASAFRPLPPAWSNLDPDLVNALCSGYGIAPLLFKNQGQGATTSIRESLSLYFADVTDPHQTTLGLHALDDLAGEDSTKIKHPLDSVGSPELAFCTFCVLT